VVILLAVRGFKREVMKKEVRQKLNRYESIDGKTDVTRWNGI
jgi:hypothetical protein